MDLKKSMVKGELPRPLTGDEILEMRRRAEDERERRIAMIEAEKRRKKQERLQKLREVYEQRRLEKQRQKEWMKPREDLLCEDNRVRYCLLCIVLQQLILSTPCYPICCTSNQALLIQVSA